MNQNQLVSYEIQEDTIAVLTLQRPEKRNAVNAEMAGQMRSAVASLQDDPRVRVVILTGGDAVFCAGMDLDAFKQGQGEEIFGRKGRFAGFVAAELQTPCIAAVEGFALAGGFELALACDLIVAAENAVFGLPEVTVGLFASAGGAFRLPLLTAPKKAMEYLLTGERFSATQAEALGLVNQVVPAGQALEGALRLARKIAANAPLGVQANLRLARQAAAAQEEAFWAANDELWQQVSQSRDAREGPQAFLDKRAPKWEGA